MVKSREEARIYVVRRPRCQVVEKKKKSAADAGTGTNVRLIKYPVNGRYSAIDLSDGKRREN